MSNPTEFKSLTTYMGRIARELRPLPQAVRDQELREIESHLRALIDARKNEGRADAEEAAFTQFGDPRSIGRGLRRAWAKRRQEPVWRAWLSAFGALLCNACLLHFLEFNLIWFVPPSNVAHKLWLFVPFVSGLWAVLASPMRGWWATLTAYLTVAALFWISFPKEPWMRSWPILAALPALCAGLWCGTRWTQPKPEPTIVE